MEGSGLGVLRAGHGAQSASFAALPAAARALARSPSPLLVITKANTRSTVHRDGYTDYVGVKRFDAQGSVTGEHRFVGLFTRRLCGRTSETPLLRRKVEAIARRAGFSPDGHLAKALQHTGDLPARRPVPDSEESCTRRLPASSPWASGTGCGCSCGRTRSTASSPACCSCRARASPRSCA